MESAQSFTDHRNKLLIKLAWGVTLLAVLANLMQSTVTSYTLILASIFAIGCSVVTFLTYQRKGRPCVSYLTAVVLTLVLFLSISCQNQHALLLYLLTFVNTAVLTLSMNYKPILLTGALNMMVTYSLAWLPNLHDNILGEISPNYFGLIHLCLSLVLGTSAYEHARVQQRIWNKQKENLNLHLTSEALVENLKVSVENLYHLSRNLQERVLLAGRASDQIFSSFNSLTSAISEQASAVDMDDAIRGTGHHFYELIDHYTRLRDSYKLASELGHESQRNLHLIEERVQQTLYLLSRSRQTLIGWTRNSNRWAAEFGGKEGPSSLYESDLYLHRGNDVLQTAFDEVLRMKEQLQQLASHHAQAECQAVQMENSFHKVHAHYMRVSVELSNISNAAVLSTSNLEAIKQDMEFNNQEINKIIHHYREMSELVQCVKARTLS
ncbi:hypothetical protein Q5741_19230 [Paenibacillus sp. JX-17]|uniref:Methyl-accepting chemotaxis protein n=2 Tax=Paenibacillus lacisoli TaxID=3064525 RepID=A0ABT9CJ17_9BACL|nr:hypothetical protein [Paenibacillus sp. JX-17]